MAKARELIWGGLVDAWDAGLELILVNILWFVFSLLVVTLPPAQAGLYYATNQLAHRQAIGWRTFFEGFRRFFWMGWRWTLVNLLVLGLLASNYIFYGQVEAEWSALLQGMMPGIGGIWLAIQTFVFPLLLEQEDRRQWVALRNSVVIILQFPAVSLLLFLILVLLAAASFAFQVPWFLITASLSSFLANRVVVDVLARVQPQVPEQS